MNPGMILGEGAGQSKLSSELSFFRRATSPKLLRLCDALAAWESRPEGVEIHMPQPTGPPSLRLEDIRTKEVADNLAFLDRSWLTTEKTQNAIRSRVPSIDRDLSMLITGVRHTGAEGGDQFLSLLLSRDEATQLGGERASLWNALELTRGLEFGTLRWKAYNPRVELIYIPSEAAVDDIPANLEKVIRSALPLPVTLSPLEFPAL